MGFPRRIDAIFTAIAHALASIRHGKARVVRDCLLVKGGVLKAKSVSVEVHYSQTDWTGSTGSITQNLKSAGFKTVHELPGIGSAAVWASNSILGRAQAELTVIHGRSVMLIIILNGIPNETEALARAR